MKLKRQEGFSLIELLIVVAIIGIIATIAVPQLLDAVERSRQRRSMGDMRNLATAIGTYRVDWAQYPAALATLVPDYMQVVPVGDGWGTAYQYAIAGTDYTLESFGSDGADGGAALPTPWVNEPYDIDIEMTNGQFTQAPQAR